MNSEPTTQSVLFPDLFAGKQVVVKLDQEHSSSDGGALLLKAVDEELGLTNATNALAACVEESRQPGKIRHDLEELLRQRMFGIACGYADANDAARIADDPMQNLLVGRDPIAGTALAGGLTTHVQYNNSGTIAGNANFVWDNSNGRVGIGTTSPSEALHVVGNAYLSANLYSARVTPWLAGSAERR